MRLCLTCPICLAEIEITLDQPDPSTGYRGYNLDDVAGCSHTQLLLGQADCVDVDAGLDHWQAALAFQTELARIVDVAIAYP